MSLLENLSEVQREAATHIEGPLVVFAGAGSGKTRIITSRIAYLIEQGYKPWEILALTFTNKAAREMRDRVQRLSLDGTRVPVSTFHSMCARWLREFATELGFRSDFSIYDDSDSTAALKKVIKATLPHAELAPTVVDSKAFMHKAKTCGLLPHQIEQNEATLGGYLFEGAIQIYKNYQEFLATCNGMDFGDLLLNVLLLFRKNKRVKEILQTRYQFILVDEFQDTNTAQLELIQFLCEKTNNLFVVGDDDQSIYSWRGATPGNILRFEEMYPGAKRVTMAENYRSASNIVAAAGAMIANNTVRAEKKLFSNVPEGQPIRYRIEADGEMEAVFVAETIKQNLLNYRYDDFAIFYRTNAQSRQLEDALRMEGIPYRIYGSLKFYDRLEIKDLIAYFRVLVNPDDDVSFKRIINVPARGIGAKAIEQLEAEANRRKMSMLAAARAVVQDRVPRLAQKLSIAVTVIDEISRKVKECPLDDVVSEVMDITGYKDHLQKKFPEQVTDKIDNLHELSNAIADFSRKNDNGTLAQWLQLVSLMRDESEDEEVEGVSLMTLHMAKGLEFPFVMIVGTEDGIVPHRNNIEKRPELEEERRLFYVGMTRAREILYFVGAQQRLMYGQFQVNEPSRFLREIPAKYLKIESKYVSDAYLTESEDGEMTYDFDEDCSTEDRFVNHPTYGKGVVEKVEDEMGRRKAIVRFFEFGRRKVSIEQLD